ncbi:hypothetical protein GCM10027269_50050 [Kribbella endophytica]
MTPLLLVGALVLVAGCGGSDDSGAPAAADSKITPLSQGDFSGKVQAALAAKKTFQVVTTTTDADGPATFTTNVRLAGAAADVQGSALESTFVRVGGTLYGKGGQLSSDPKKPWVMYDPTGKGAGKETSAIMAGAMLQLLGAQLDQYRVAVATSPYATDFKSAAGEPVDGVATAKYTMTVNVLKATQAQAFGQYLTSETAAQSGLTELPIEVTVDAESLPRTFAYEADGAKVSGTFGKFGEPVTITAPAATEIA